MNNILERRRAVGLILLVILILLLLGAMPTWPYSRSWGYGPSGLAGVLLVVLVILLAFSVIPWGFGPAVAPHPVVYP
jgi:hypothetical protein